jgi:hypothetical protein
MSDLYQKVELHLQGRNLSDLDVFSKSDPQAFVYIKEKKKNNWKLIGQTEKINDNLNPNWSQTIILSYHFEELQELKFEVYDIDNDKKDLKSQDYIGSMQCCLGDIVGSPGSKLMKALKNPKISNPGHLIVSAEEVGENIGSIYILFKAKDLDRKGLFTFCYPFIRISRVREDGSYDVVYKSEAQKRSTRHPVFSKIHISAQKLCNNDLHRNLKVECFHKGFFGSEVLIGEFMTTAAKLQEANLNNTSIVLKNSIKKKNSGIFLVHLFEVKRESTFLEFIRGGLDINLIVGIDFTSSNGDPQNPSSLHFLGPNNEVLYTIIIYL